MPSWEDADEDVDNLDDEQLIEACLGLGSGGQSKPGARLFAQSDWPPEAGTPLSVDIDADIAAWFQSRSVAWRAVINAILRGWIEANSKEDQRPIDG